MQFAKERQAQLLEHAETVQRCIRRVPGWLRQTREQKLAFDDLKEHIGFAHHILSCQEDEVEGEEPSQQVVSILESEIMSAREMLTLDDSTFGWSLLDLTEEQVMEQVLAFLR